MCGIAGMMSFAGGDIDHGLLTRMIGMVRHRGPDSFGAYVDHHVGLAHARLSIIDLEGGRQPMHNGDKTLWITFNGEIFNYVELREDLIRRGHRFATSSDTEVILHLFEEKGESCVRDLNGQWAFALWDVKRRRLFLSRDRVGVRPLFYTVVDGNFAFASEIKSLFCHPAVVRELDLQALDQIFTFWFALAPRTIFKGVCELPPGHSLVVEDGAIRARTHWRLEYPNAAMPAGERECAEELLAVLTDATRLRLRADVPVGAYLSGGLDSTLIAALIKKVSITPLKTFSVSFEDPEFDESAFQRKATEYLHTDHAEIRCSGQEIGRIFPDVIWQTEQPILRTAPAPLFLLSKLVRQSGFKVVLTGEGADEMLGGYDIFKEAKIRRFWGMRPGSRIRPLLLRRLYPYLPALQSQSSSYLQAFFRVRSQDLSHPLFSHLPRWELTARLKAMYSEAVKSQLNGHDPCAELLARLPKEYSTWDGFSQAQYLEATGLLPGYILSSQGDRMAMAHSVEGRFPFLDHRVVELASRIPARLKMKALSEKYILKKAAGNLIPASIKRRAKQPYRAPDAASFFGEPDRPIKLDYVGRLLSAERITKDGIFNPVAVQRLVEKVRRGQAIGAKDNMALVGVLSTQLVIDLFINHFEEKVGNAIN